MKQVILVRKDLKMSKGKMAAQVAHASLAAYKVALKRDEKRVKKWEREGAKKVVLYVADEKELFEMKERLRGIPKQVVIDAGKTQIAPGTVTCMGVGPWDDEAIDRITGHLKLVS
ncbi:peptidyl-tRNA hydrolase [Candidatus Micrarchaeota archaeon]|nr:MAG: peptidyl-tRNA hydrolase [Candidatus Micrarchaeota archaeon]